MARIELRHIRHAYGAKPTQEEDYALKEVHHIWQDGGAYALLGPSGCGKTTLLNIISGLLTPSEGQVMFDKTDVTALSPERRNIAQVFQFPVVYDTMTVYENLAFPLRNRGVGPQAIKTRVAQVLEMLDLGQLQNKRARGLSADLKQKISLGRGMVREDVRAILFDEPLTVIDPHMKWQLRAQLKRLHKQFGRTMVYVTHDQTEALTFADKVAVMLDGEILQFGTPEDLFKKPRHTFVGYFIGSPGMNILPITIDGANARLGESTIALPASVKAGRGKTELGIRPEYISLTRNSDGLPVTISKIEDIGRQKIVRANLYGHNLAIVIGEDDEVPTDAKVSFAPDGINIYADDLRVEPGEAQ